jgi:hypothetical protein
MAYKFVGIALDDFVEWSTSDPDYANDGAIIERRHDRFSEQPLTPLEHPMKRSSFIAYLVTDAQKPELLRAAKSARPSKPSNLERCCFARSTPGSIALGL